MSPHYDRFTKPAEQPTEQSKSATAADEEIENAAEAIREAEIEAVQSSPPPDVQSPNAPVDAKTHVD